MLCEKKYKVMHCLTFDIEDWFHNIFLEKVIPPHKWDNEVSVVKNGVDIIIDLLGKNNIKATFFVLGWIADKYPDICEKIAYEGHEIATHGYYHKLVDKQTKEEFIEDVGKSINSLKKITGIAPIGYRAPVASVNAGSKWVFECLKEIGIKYDSSIYPTDFLVYGGIKNSPREKYEIIDNFWEVPFSVLNLKIFKIPISGGFYLRTLPFFIYKYAFKDNHEKGISMNLYVHPWEIYSEFPNKIGNPLFSWTQKRGNGQKLLDKIDYLIKNYEFDTIRNVHFQKNLYKG